VLDRHDDVVEDAEAAADAGLGVVPRRARRISSTVAIQVVSATRSSNRPATSTRLRNLRFVSGFS
jgi:hypothetical protein